MIMNQRVGDSVVNLDFPIAGLAFRANRVAETSCGSIEKVVGASTGPQISDYVTHEENFRYSTAGIHIGQDDRLTFMGDERTTDDIVGYFTDCRKGSPTLHQQVVISYQPSLYRHLVIPRGVAHTFDNLAYVVTRDEPVWHASRDNPHWNVDNDLVAVARSIPPEQYPVVDVNNARLPGEAHRFMSRLSQELLKNPKAYLSRHRVTLNGEERYVSLEPKGWNADREAVAAIYSSYKPGIEGVAFFDNRFAMTGPKSWTLVPNTPNCIADPIVIGPNTFGPPPALIVHELSDRIFTLLNYQDRVFTLDLVDLREGSPTFRIASTLHLIADPRYCMHIPSGVAYRVTSDVSLLARIEAVSFGEVPVIGLADMRTIDPATDTLVLADRPKAEVSAKEIYHAHVAHAAAMATAA